MATTDLWYLTYPDPTDPPDIARFQQFLAEDVDAGLGKLKRVPVGQSRPPAVPDNTNLLIWDDVEDAAFRCTGSAWEPFPRASTGGDGGGGGGGSSATGGVWDAWQASGAQSIPSGNDVTVAFGTALGDGDGAVTRSSSGAGHLFTLTQTRLWTITATLRAAQNGTGGRLATLLTGGGTPLAKVGGDAPTTAPWTVTLARARRLPANTTLKLVFRHNAGTSLALDPEGGPSVSIDFVGV